MKKTVVFLSDHTGLTAEAMGMSLLSQFRDIDYDVIHKPFVDSREKVQQVVREINHIAAQTGEQPIIFSTLVDPEIRQPLKDCQCLVLDYFESYTHILEKELKAAADYRHGQVHSMANANAYRNRIHAVNFALTNDDGAITRSYPDADLILLGVSRSGKTPTCLYMGLQYGVLAANYPLTEDDLQTPQMPKALREYKDKLYGLTIDPMQLQRIRQERRSNGRYANLEQCRWEVDAAEKLYKRHQIPFINSTAMSIEEMAVKILADLGVKH
ncbi:MAG TPA: kinase/pyrophosphorylase [Halieaceae bacterium]|nr:kinase/pyrophosphorylase [Halieaceae bacterium]